MAAAILAGCEDPRARLLFEQFAKAKKRNRSESGNGFTVEPGSVEADLRVDLDVDVASAWVAVRDVASGRPIEFQVRVRAGGTFGALEARAPDGEPWPSPWSVDGLELAQSARNALKL